ncbi:MAG: hybrid sensor histidine kinase/response regulator [Bacteroidales bacterium]|nr:hybrid sensor histidine kinase/response regulator [Bacteroidales bacterium]
MDKKYNILYVDDEVSNLNVFKNTFRRDYNIFIAESARDGLEILDREKIDLVLTDQRMPEMTGVDFLKSVMVKHPGPSRILITAYTDFNALKDAVNEAKIFQYIQKPWDEGEIRQIIDNALDIHYLRLKNQHLTRELQKKNSELVRLNEELIDLDKIKFQFLNIISHEIRTPLNGLLGAASLFKSEFEAEEFRKYKELFDILDGSAQRLAHFLLLAERITSLKARHFELKPEPFDLHRVIHGIVDEKREKLDKKQLKLKLGLSNSPESCFAEKQLIEICLSEVLDNAIKHSERGGSIYILTESHRNDIMVKITDEGNGFPEHVMKNIFKPFITHEDITKEGMGLDLALINQIVKAHQGTIKISNNPTRGACVQLIFNKLPTER